MACAWSSEGGHGRGVGGPRRPRGCLLSHTGFHALPRGVALLPPPEPDHRLDGAGSDTQEV